jgi:uncharacterized protein (TIGR02145 family)
MKIQNELYSIKKVVPAELELKGYLKQCCNFDDKRQYLEISASIIELIELKGFDQFNISEIPIDEVINILNEFKILPKHLYFSLNDTFAKYDSPDFGVIIKNIISKRSDKTFDWDYPSNDDEILENAEDVLESENLVEKNDNELASDAEENIDLINFLPKFYDSTQVVDLENGKILIANFLNNQIIDLYTETGEILSIKKIDSWRESNYISSCKISIDKKTILINFLGRFSSWATFEYINHSFIYKNSDYSFFELEENSLPNFYPIEEFETVIKKQNAEKEQIKLMPFSVIIGSQEWTTRNLETSNFRNGDLIQEASTDKEWEAAAQNKLPAWCYYENNQQNGTKYGKLYNWFAVSDPRGLAPDGWRIPNLEDWNQLNDYLSLKVNIKLMGSDEWEYDYSMSSLFTKDKAPKPIRKVRKSKKFNETGFHALPSGARGEFGNHFFALKDSAYWWTSNSVETQSEESKSESTEVDVNGIFDENDTDKQAYFTLLYVNDELLQIGNYTNKKSGFSVRCIKNNNE